MDRKALKQAYKETRRPMGIYRVRNTVHDRSLVGATVDLPAMLNRQQAQLRFGGHPNKFTAAKTICGIGGGGLGLISEY